MPGWFPERADPVMSQNTAAVAARAQLMPAHAVQDLPAVSAMASTYMPDMDELLSGNLGHIDDTVQAVAIADDTEVSEHSASLLRASMAWVAGARQELTRQEHVRPVGTLMRTCNVGPQFISHARQTGLALYEPFGGMEMALRNGFRVRRYLYSDTDPVAQRVVAHRVEELSALYPTLFDPSAAADMLTALPMDVTTITRQHLVDAGIGGGDVPWLLVAGWSCQDLSPAGKGVGLQGTRSGTFYNLLNLLRYMQELMPENPPAYIIENVSLEQPGVCAEMKSRDNVILHGNLGRPLQLDAARLGARARRLRSYWTNLAQPHDLQLVFDTVVRPVGRTVQDILDAGRLPKAVTTTERAPYYPANQPGELRAALPTLMATTRSYAFRDDGPGEILDTATGSVTEPNADERERAMGYRTGTTAAPDVSEAQRCKVLGRAMDAQCMEAILAVSCALLSHVPVAQQVTVATTEITQLEQRHGVGARLVARMGWRVGHALGLHGGRRTIPSLPPIPLRAPEDYRGVGYNLTGRVHNPLPRSPPLGAVRPFAPFTPARSVPLHTSGPEAQPAWLHVRRLLPTTPATPANDHQHSCLAHVPPDPPLPVDLAQAAEAVQWGDIWRDKDALQYLHKQEFPVGTDPAKAQRVQRRARRYTLQAGVLYRRMPDGTLRQVPQPAQRAALIRDTHEQTGHFGARRTCNLVATSYWWYGMGREIADLVRTCEACDRVRASFNAHHPVLTPLPIEGLF